MKRLIFSFLSTIFLVPCVFAQNSQNFVGKISVLDTIGSTVYQTWKSGTTDRVADYRVTLSSDTTNSATTTFKWTPLAVWLDSNTTYIIKGHLFVTTGTYIGFHFPAGCTMKIDESGPDSTATWITQEVTADSTAGYVTKGVWMNLQGAITTGSTTGYFIVMHKKSSTGAQISALSTVEAIKQY